MIQPNSRQKNRTGPAFAFTGRQRHNLLLYILLVIIAIIFIIAPPAQGLPVAGTGHPDRGSISGSGAAQTPALFMAPENFPVRAEARPAGCSARGAHS